MLEIVLHTNHCAHTVAYTDKCMFRWFLHCRVTLTLTLLSSAGRGGPLRSWEGAVGGSARPQQTLPPAPPAKVTPETTGCFFPCGRTATCHTAACASTTRPRASSTPSQSSSRHLPRAARHGRKWWTTHSSAASERKPVAKAKEMTEVGKISLFFLFRFTFAMKT